MQCKSVHSNKDIKAQVGDIVSFWLMNEYGFSSGAKYEGAVVEIKEGRISVFQFMDRDGQKHIHSFCPDQDNRLQVIKCAADAVPSESYERKFEQGTPVFWLDGEEKFFGFVVAAYEGIVVVKLPDGKQVAECYEAFYHITRANEILLDVERVFRCGLEDDLSPALIFALAKRFSEVCMGRFKIKDLCDHLRAHVKLTEEVMEAFEKADKQVIPVQ